MLDKPFKALISVITYNRPKGLKRLLMALQQQQFSNAIQAEILVLDNDCTGQNPKIVTELAITASIKMHVVEVPEKGIVSARNKAVEFFLQTNFQALIFIDDDEWPSENTWLQNLINAQIQTKADIVTSLVYILAEDPASKWIEKIPGQGIHNKKTTTPVNRFYTANLLIMREVLEIIKPAFDLRFAFTGSSDLHFSIRCKHAGFKAVITPYAPVKEFYPTSRANLRWFFLRGYRSGEGSTRAIIYEGSFPMAHLYCLAMFGFRFMQGIYNAFIGVVFLEKARIALSFMRLGSALGTLGGFFGLTYQEYKTIHGS